MSWLSKFSSGWLDPTIASSEEEEEQQQAPSQPQFGFGYWMAPGGKFTVSIEEIKRKMREEEEKRERELMLVMFTVTD